MHRRLSRVCSWTAYSSNSAAKKILLIVEYFVIAHAIEILHGEIVENSSFDVTLMRDHLLVCLQLQILSPFPKTNERIYRSRSVCLFFSVYCICREAYFHDDVKSDDGYFMANCNSCGEWYHKKCMNISKFSEMRSTTCSGNALLAENKLYEFRPWTSFLFYWFVNRLLFRWLGLATFFPPRNLRQSNKYLVQ